MGDSEAMETTPMTQEEVDRELVETQDHNGKSDSNLAAEEKEKLALLPAVSVKQPDEHHDPPIIVDKPPGDRYQMVYIILLLHGIGTLMPWNMFITANNYFVNYKLKTDFCEEEPTAEPTNETMTATVATVSQLMSALVNVMDNMTQAVSNATNATDCAKQTNAYQDYFLSYLGFVAQIPNVLLNGVNVFAQVGGGSTSKRIIWSIIIIVVMFIVTVVMAMLDTSEYTDAFFWTTMAIVVVINMANGVYQNSVYGLAAVLPMKYTNAVVLGSNISGTLASLIMLCTMFATPDVKVSAIYYFLTAIFVLIIAFDTYFALPLLPFYRYYKKKSEEDTTMTVKSSKTSLKVSTRPPYGYIFSKCWKQFVGVWFVFFVTLTCFPAIQANIKKTEGDYFPIPEKYFTVVTCFLFFNFFAMIGNLVTEWFRKPGPKWVWLPILLRVLFIPFFILCNFWPVSGQRGFPVYIHCNWMYVLGGILMAFSSGYFSSLTMMYAPRELKEPEYQGVAGMMAAFFLILGIFSGVVFSLPVTLLVESITVS